jgi:hypothetical protein
MKSNALPPFWVELSRNDAGAGVASTLLTRTDRVMSVDAPPCVCDIANTYFS